MCECQDFIQAENPLERPSNNHVPLVRRSGFEPSVRITINFHLSLRDFFYCTNPRQEIKPSRHAAINLQPRGCWVYPGAGPPAAWQKSEIHRRLCRSLTSAASICEKALGKRYLMKFPSLVPMRIWPPKLVCKYIMLRTVLSAQMLRTLSSRRVAET